MFVFLLLLANVALLVGWDGLLQLVLFVIKAGVRSGLIIFWGTVALVGYLLLTRDKSTISSVSREGVWAGAGIGSSSVGANGVAMATMDPSCTFIDIYWY